MSLLPDVMVARDVLRKHFPSASADPCTCNWVFDGGADAGTFNEKLVGAFQWFVSVDDATLRRCLNLPQWVWDVRNALCRINAEVTSIPAQERWGRFLLTPWLAGRRAWKEPKELKGTDYSAIPEDVYLYMQVWTIELTLCPFDGRWLADLEAHERQGPPPIDFDPDWNWVSLNGGPRIPVTDLQQRTLLRVVYEAKERIPKKEIIPTAKAKYGVDLRVKLAEVLAELPEQLRPLIDNHNSGYLFVEPPIPSGAK